MQVAEGCTKEGSYLLAPALLQLMNVLAQVPGLFIALQQQLAVLSSDAGDLPLGRLRPLLRLPLCRNEACALWECERRSKGRKEVGRGGQRGQGLGGGGKRNCEAAPPPVPPPPRRGEERRGERRGENHI